MCSFTIQSFGRSFILVALHGYRDGLDQSAHLGNMTILFFFAYHLRWMYIRKTHTGLQKYKKKYPATVFILKHVVLFVNERTIEFLPCECHSLLELQSVGCLA